MENWTYMTIMDAHSKWQKVFPLRRATTTSTMAALEKVFSTRGIPETLVSGNYTQFNSGKFTEFCTQRSIEYVRTPPYHLQSNGQDERVVDHSNWHYSKKRAKSIVLRLIKTSEGGRQVKQEKLLPLYFFCQTLVTFPIPFHLRLNVPTNLWCQGGRQELDMTGILQQSPTYFVTNEGGCKGFR